MARWGKVQGVGDRKKVGKEEKMVQEGEPLLRPNLSYWILAAGIHHSDPLCLCVLVYSFNKKKTPASRAQKHTKTLSF